ncbi:histidinol dehydrogenase [Actinoplanes sp. NEAU-A12]|uniref:Histidinol dehydrogenase n=1 Tax=Actinoplanes sandaracinus TaxID=3045177 RepID=A0ABT6WX38_9ACTN|nr:histidinol dehydrogenase [Actinoplanes sandaracinus]MDI6104307.1 histidinol dehydrogenase [Actinoplanes sandaracinus]
MTPSRNGVIAYPSPQFDSYARTSGSAGPLVDPGTIAEVRAVFRRVAETGLEAVADISRQRDGLAPGTPIVVDPSVLKAQAALVDDHLADSLREAYRAQLAVAEAALAQDVTVDVRDGVVTRLVHRPVTSVALYIPGGRERYPSTLVGLLAAARAAGVPEVTVLLPPDAAGLPDPACAWISALAGGVTTLCGNGPALIAALALGVDGVPPIRMVVGPGGPAVVAAQLIAAEHGLATGPAFGPTDCAVLAGPDADPRLLVADLLTESEHGHDPRLVLIGWGGVEHAFQEALTKDPEGEQIWARTGTIVVCTDESDAVEAANRLGGEQIQLATGLDDARRLLDRVEGYASVLLGQDTSISAAYLTGAPGCLPTGPAARSVSVVTSQTFRRTMVVGQVGPSAQSPLAELVTPLAAYEGFPRHGASQQIRSK